MIKIKTPEEIEKMRAAGQLVAQALEAICGSVVPGKTKTIHLDILAEKIIREAGGIPSFKNYRGYPASVCVSINEEVVHGIPGERVIESGDIVGIDIGAILDGYHGDSAVTFAVGEVPEVTKKLLKVTREALFAGIDKARPGNRVSDISRAIQQHAERNGYSVVRELVGHGIGSEMHEDPPVPNYVGPGPDPVLKAGMTLAIEPMVNVGGYAVKYLSDKWTVVTKDRSLSAHFEHTVAVTNGEPDILTLRSEEKARQ